MKNVESVSEHGSGSAVRRFERTGAFTLRLQRRGTISGTRVARRAGVDDEIGLLGVAAASAYGKPRVAFARQKLTRRGFDERSNHSN
jgi:hypothetical protein